MTAVLSIIIATLALGVSATTAWLTLFRRGRVKMTTPTVVYFGPDGGGDDDRPTSKVYLRTLLYCTAHRGRIVGSMFVRLRRGESAQTFNVWVYGDDSLSRGSGVFVGEDGVVCNHHFLLPSDGTTFEFKAGDYVLEVFASVVGDWETTRLHRAQLTVGPEFAEKLADKTNGLYFDWGVGHGALPRPRPAATDAAGAVVDVRMGRIAARLAPASRAEAWPRPVRSLHGREATNGDSDVSTRSEGRASGACGRSLLAGHEVEDV